MKKTVKTLGLLTAVSAISVAYAASPRVSIMTSKTQNASTRLPSVAGYIKSSGAIATGTTTTTSTAASLLTNSECIDSYTSCLKGADVCGSDFEECTTNVLLHAKMPNCFSILSQCTTSGVNDLFGTGSVTALANVESKNSYGEVTRYSYPTDGSVLGQLIIGAKISNMLTTDQCVKRYMNCLHRDNVCGEDFELCTTNTEFKKQSIYCASTLARCQGDGITELYGSTNTSSAPSGTSRLGVAITDGASLAALNAVSTCYKVADQCILNACGANPYKCMVDSQDALVKIADAINEGTLLSLDELKNMGSAVTSSQVMKYLRTSCRDTIGGNKYCYAVALGNGSMPSSSQLRDEDNKDEVFSSIYSDRVNTVVKQKIADLANKFDSKAKDRCVNTIRSCAMRSCGNGLGSVCYSQVFGQDGENSINGKATYETIKTSCESIVNTDANCQYAAAAIKGDTYTYAYTDNSVFTTLFPEYDGTGNDPISAVGSLNASLSSSYNDAAIAKMKKDCSNVATSCVKSLCGTDYINCYRNRTDVMTDTYNTGSAKFDKSMNKVGGVLDYTIVTGLCINQVKNASTCDEHLKIEAFKLKAGESSSTWGSGSVRGDWLDAAKSIKVTNMPEDVVVGCKTLTQGDNCNPNTIEACDYVDEDGCLYDQPVTETWDEYSISNAAKNLFQQILMDIEKEAQAKYNAKLTKEQSICLNNNVGGVMGTKDNGSAFLWVKLKSNRVPKNYPMKGLSVNQFSASNDLYGSFCRARITVMSDDKAIQDFLGADTTAYFAVGDAFTCGSWISQKTLDKISKAVAEKAEKEAGKDSKKDAWARAWWTTAGTLVGGIGSFAAMDSLQQNGNTLGGLINPNKDEEKANDTKTAAKACKDNVATARQAYSQAAAYYDDPDQFAVNYNYAVAPANRALENAKTISKIQGSKIEGLTLKNGLFRNAVPENKVNLINQKNLLFAVELLPEMPPKKDVLPGTFDEYQKQKYGETCSWNGNDQQRAKDAKDAIAKAGENQGCRPQNGRTTSGHDCWNAILDVEDMLGETPSEGLAEKVMNKLNEAKTACNTNNKDGKHPCASVDIPTNLKITCVINKPTGGETSTADKPTTPTTTTSDSGEKVVATEVLRNSDGSVAGTKNTILDRDEYASELVHNLDVIESYCAQYENVRETNNARRNRNLIAGGVGALGGGILAYKIAQSAQEIKYENAANEAVKEWMEDVGSHIQCYVGGEELGEYGDPIVIELD